MKRRGFDETIVQIDLLWTAQQKAPSHPLLEKNHGTEIITRSFRRLGKLRRETRDARSRGF
jgi:hypothetical protein